MERPEWLEASYNALDPEHLLLAAERMTLIAQLLKAKDKAKAMKKLGLTKADLIEYLGEITLPAQQQLHLRIEIENSADELRCRVDRSKSPVRRIK